MSEMKQHPVVQLKEGAIRGKVDAGAAAFLGIPYAAPPFGANRMRAPQSVQPWEGERDATAFGPTVPKGDYPPQYTPLFPEVVIPGEDCREPVPDRPGRTRGVRLARTAPAGGTWRPAVRRRNAAGSAATRGTGDRRTRQLGRASRQGSARARFSRFQPEQAPGGVRVATPACLAR
jgi:hypothetical protein